MADLNKTFGLRLRTLRDQRGLTQEDLGRLVRIDYKHIGAIERGVKSPSFELVEKLAAVLKVKPYQLFLPVETADGDVEEDLQAALKDVGQARRARIQRFLQEVLRVSRRLDAR